MSNRILVVEDDASHRMTLEQHLGSAGYRVLAAESAEGALAQVAAFKPDIVLSDIRLPQMSGLELLQKLREARAQLPVILATGFSEMRSAIEAMKQGAYEYLVKPLDLDELEQTLERCLRAQRSRPHEPADDAVEPTNPDGVLVGKDPRMVRIYKLIGRLAQVSTPVLIRGETGTGKEVVARLIHQNSANAQDPFVAVNCSALPDTLLESELFGHARGAFTGAVTDLKGRFEVAGRGTIFLDEIADVSLAFQAKLLRVLQEREFQPLGCERSRRTEARVIGATHGPLEAMMGRGEFREDLYFRLRVVEISIPPLRERRADIPLLVEHILRAVCAELGRDLPRIRAGVVQTLVEYDWPGNVRELENVLTRAVVLSNGEIGPEQILVGVGAENGPADALAPEDDEPLESLERRYVRRVLARTGGHKTEAARILGISRPRLNRLLRKSKLTRPT
jgi:DNA-binding NtrC family response regulator